MLAKRIIACLDIKNYQIIKGKQFKKHDIIGNPEAFAKFYSEQGIDELVLYDITASPDQKTVDDKWISKIAMHINIPFCVSGGIRNLDRARSILENGADKISINSPALSNPDLINRLSQEFGTQCVVVGIDSLFNKQKNIYQVWKYAGSSKKMRVTHWKTEEWIQEVQNRGAGEIVLNTIHEDGMLNGYDIIQLKKMRTVCNIPLIASGGAGNMHHFFDVFRYTHCNGALAASVFHKKIVRISVLKQFLFKKGVRIRLC